MCLEKSGKLTMKIAGRPKREAWNIKISKDMVLETTGPSSCVLVWRDSNGAKPVFLFEFRTKKSFAMFGKRYVNSVWK